MDRPTDIPQSVWEVATLAWSGHAHPVEPEDCPAVERVARALMAQIERDAGIANKFTGVGSRRIATAIRSQVNG